MAFEKTFHLLLVFALMMAMVNGHIAAWSKGMYCLNGTTPGEDNGNNNAPVTPLFKLKRKDWWMHHVNKCDEFPPAPGDFLELPANGNFTVELATNRAFTTLSGDGEQAGVFPGPLTGGITGGLEGVAKAAGAKGTFKIGKEGVEGEVPGCIVDPNMHTQNETTASGTAFAISYTSDLSKVTLENLAVFSVLEHTPFKRLATYQVPNLPACPEGGCICTWGWIPNGCGEPNMYFFPYRCKVTGTPGPRPLALPARPPSWCDMSLPQGTLPSNATANASSLGSCYHGPKQMLVWNQLEGDNIEVLDGELGERLGSPGYNEKVGFKPGAQTDIFATAGEIPSTKSIPVSTSGSSSTVVVSASTATSLRVSTLSSSRTIGTTSTSVVISSPLSASTLPSTTHTVTTPTVTSSSKPFPFPIIPLSASISAITSSSLKASTLPSTTSTPSVITSIPTILLSSSTPTMTTVRLVSEISSFTSTAQGRSTTRQASSAAGLVADRRLGLGLVVLSSGLVGLVLAF